MRWAEQRLFLIEPYTVRSIRPDPHDSRLDDLVAIIGAGLTFAGE
jgi:hypothetical protein